MVISCAHHVVGSDWSVSTDDIKSGEASVGLSDLWAKFELDETTMVCSKINFYVNYLIEEMIMSSVVAKKYSFVLAIKFVIYLASVISSGDYSFVVGSTLVSMGLSESISTTSAPREVNILNLISTHYSSIVPPEGHLCSETGVSENGRSGKRLPNVAMRRDAG